MRALRPNKPGDMRLLERGEVGVDVARPDERIAAERAELPQRRRRKEVPAIRGSTLEDPCVEPLAV